MNKLLLALAVSLISLSAQAAIIGTPFSPEEDLRFNALETGSSIGARAITETMLATPAAGTTGLFPARVAKAIWDPSGITGQRTVAPHDLGVMIPAHSIITRAWFYTKTSVTSTSNNGTIAFSCQAANDIFSAADIDSSSGVAGSIGAGVEDGDPANMKYMTGACDIVATVGTNAFLTGKIDLFVEYVTVGE